MHDDFLKRRFRVEFCPNTILISSLLPFSGESKGGTIRIILKQTES